MGLPSCFSTLFSGYKFTYKNQVLASTIEIFRGKAVRAIKVGDFAYIEQNKLGMDEWAKRARKGQLIMHIYNFKTNTRVATVVNGTVHKVN